MESRSVSWGDWEPYCCAPEDGLVAKVETEEEEEVGVRPGQVLVRLRDGCAWLSGSGGTADGFIRGVWGGEGGTDFEGAEKGERRESIAGSGAAAAGEEVAGGAEVDVAAVAAAVAGGGDDARRVAGGSAADALLGSVARLSEAKAEADMGRTLATSCVSRERLSQRSIQWLGVVYMQDAGLTGGGGRLWWL